MESHDKHLENLSDVLYRREDYPLSKNEELALELF